MAAGSNRDTNFEGITSFDDISQHLVRHPQDSKNPALFEKALSLVESEYDVKVLAEQFKDNPDAMKWVMAQNSVLGSPTVPSPVSRMYCVKDYADVYKDNLAAMKWLEHQLPVVQDHVHSMWGIVIYASLFNNNPKAMQWLKENGPDIASCALNGVYDIDKLAITIAQDGMYKSLSAEAKALIAQFLYPSEDNPLDRVCSLNVELTSCHLGFDRSILPDAIGRFDERFESPVPLQATVFRTEEPKPSAAASGRSPNAGL